MRAPPVPVRAQVLAQVLALDSEPAPALASVLAWEWVPVPVQPESVALPASVVVSRVSVVVAVAWAQSAWQPVVSAARRPAATPAVTVSVAIR